MVPEKLAEELSPFVEEHGLRRVLEALAAVCFMKADEHAESGEGDPREWERAAVRLGRATGSLEV